jgi:FMN-dependent NADH-azoreductase
MKPLHIDSSILGQASARRAVTREAVARWHAVVPGLEVTHLDLAVARRAWQAATRSDRGFERQRVAAERARAEHVETCLKFVFGFIGIRDITVVRAEGLAISPENRQKGLDSAPAAIPVPAALAA